MYKTIVGVLLAALLAGLSAGQGAVAQEQTIYKWVDEEGVVHYTARPPEGVDYQEVGIETREPVDSAAGDGGGDDEAERTAEDDTATDPGERETLGPDPEVVAERCEQARRNIENLTRYANVLVRGEDGEQREVTEEERKRMLEEARQFVEEWC
jgi:hypothetical protein